MGLGRPDPRELRLAVLGALALQGAAEAGYEPDESWRDSYSVADQCYCDTSYDHDIGSVEVMTPAGTRTVREVCEAIGPGPGPIGNPAYNDVQCGNGPANDAGDEDAGQCPGRVDMGEAGCLEAGPTWNLARWFADQAPKREQTATPGTGEATAPPGRQFEAEAGANIGFAWQGAIVDEVEAMYVSAAFMPESMQWTSIEASPMLYFRIDFPEAGRYPIHVRLHALGWNEAIVRMTLDEEWDRGVEVRVGEDAVGCGTSDWVWSGCAGDGNVAIVDVEASGWHALRLGAGSAPLAIDAIVVGERVGDSERFDEAVDEAPFVVDGEIGKFPFPEEVGEPAPTEEERDPAPLVPPVSVTSDAPEIGEAIEVGKGTVAGSTGAGGLLMLAGALLMRRCAR